MSSVITYYFNSKSTSIWTDAAKMIDNILSNYANASSEGYTEVLDGNTGPGTNLGTITKVEIRAFAYGDDNDRIDLTPVFTGGDGDEHQTTPGVPPGSWGGYQDITEDPNSPQELTAYESYTTGDNTTIAIYQDWWESQTFTPSSTHDIDSLKLKLRRTGLPGTITVSIKATDGEGKPTGDDLLVTTFDGDTLTTDTYGEWKTILFYTSISLLASIKYAIVIRCDGSSSNHLSWRADATSPTYTGGMRCVSADSGGSWGTSSTYDFMFEEGASTLWSWSAVQNLDCKVEKDTVLKGNEMYCAKVEIRVTYTPTAGGVVRSYGYIF